MYKDRLLLILFILCLQNMAYSQNRTIQGTLADSNKAPVMYAAIILQSADKEIIASQLSDSLGCFSFKELSLPTSCLMIIQHVAYENDTLIIDNQEIPNPIYLKERTNDLGEVVIAAKKPFLKIQHDTFIYDMSHIRNNRAVLNAYESLKEIPGIIEDSKQLLLAGASELKITINGQVSSLSTEQVLTMLKSTPASRIKEIEVLYNAPSKYNTQGALINIKLKDNIQDNHHFSGEITADYSQSYYAFANPNASVSFHKGKLSMDVIGNFQKGKTWGYSTAYTQHSIDSHIDEIIEKTVSKGQITSFNARMSGNYKFNSQSDIAFSYYFRGIKDVTNNTSNTRYDSSNEIYSLNSNHDNSYLHNMNLQYTFRKMNVGADCIYYRNPTTINYQDNNQEGKNDLKNISLQDVSKYAVFVNNISEIGSHIQLSYGTNLKYNESCSHIDYFYSEGKEYIEEKENGLYSKQREIDINIFAEAKYKLNEHWYIRTALKSNYFKSEYNDGHIQKTLWNDCILYPNANVSYTHNQNNRFQLSFSTNKRYPSYWAVNPQTTNLSSYTSIVGNPELKPNRTFIGRFIYTYRKKYTFIWTTQYSPDYFIQIPHMSEDKLKMIYRYENFDYKLQNGFTLLVPIQWGSEINSQFTFMGSRTREKIAQFYGTSFDNIFYDAYISVNNSFKFASQWLFQIDLNFRSPSRQGVYKLGSTLNGNIRLKWDIANATYITLRYDNLFQRQMPHPMEIYYGKQYRSIRNKEKGELGISVTWNIRNFKSKRYKTIDMQRLDK